MENLETVKNVRIAGREPVDLTIGELSWKDEEEITNLIKKKVLNQRTGNFDVEYDLMKRRRLNLLRSIKKPEGITEADLLATNKRDVLRISNAYDRLNEITVDEKRSSDEDDNGGQANSSELEN